MPNPDGAVAPARPANPDTVKVRYVGIHDEVYLPSLADLTVARGEVATVPADAAPSLLEQVGNWELATA